MILNLLSKLVDRLFDILYLQRYQRSALGLREFFVYTDYVVNAARPHRVSSVCTCIQMICSRMQVLC